MFKTLFILIVTISSLCFSPNCMANLANAVSKDKQKTIVASLSKQLIDNYVFPEVANKVANQLLLNINNDEYLGYDEVFIFAGRLTDDIQAMTQDKHIRVKLQHPGHSISSSHDIEQDFEKVEILEGNIGLIKFDQFSSNPKVKNKIDRIFAELSDIDALIIDLRSNGGGSPDLVRYISSYFFDKKTHLNSIYWRATNRNDEYWTIDDLPSRKRPDLPIYILTSKNTFSAAEEFTYNLKVRKRAYVVGEKTKGGANPGGYFDLPFKLSIFIPTGRAINPITQTNWEGAGVSPDLPVISVLAFEEAYAMAKHSAVNYRITQGKAKPEEKYSIKPYQKRYGKWTLAKNNCPLKYRVAQPEYNEQTRKYQFPYQIKYYGNGSANIRYQLGNISGKMEHTLYFKNRKEEKSGISIGFSSFDTINISKCKILKD
jgi:hypothetical protein